MKISDIASAMAGLSVQEAGAVVTASDHLRASNEALAALEPAKKRRGRKPGVKKTAKVAAPKPTAKKPAKKSSKSLPDKFEE